MNILFISQLLPIEGQGLGSSIALMDFLQEWNKKEKVQAIRPLFRYEKLPHWKDGQTEEGAVPVKVIRPFRIPLLKTTSYPLRKLIRGLTEKPDVVVCHLYNSYFPFRKLAKNLDIPFVVGIHMSDIRFSANPFHKRLQALALANCQAIACRSPALLEKFTRIYPEHRHKCFPVVSGLPAAYVKYAAAGQLSAGDGKNSGLNFVTVASLIALKHIDQVLRALAGLKQFPWTYTIVGEGPLEKELKALCRELELDERVHFTGRLKRDEGFGLMKTKEVFIMTSYPETLGLAYLEAMAAGNLVVGTQGWGVDGIIKDGENGYLVKPGDSRHLQAVLEDILSAAPEKILALRKAGQHAAAHLSQESMSQAYLDKIRETVQNFTPRG